MINIIISKDAKANSHYLYKKIEKRLDENKKSILIVPEQYTLETDIDFLRSIKYESVMDAKVLSFSSFANFLIDKSEGKKIEFLNKEGKVILLANILQDLNDKLELFENSYQNIDFINSIVTLISSFKDNNFDQNFFDQIQNSQVSDISKIKFEEIRLIIDTYQDQIRGKYLDQEDVLSYVAENIKNTDFLDDYEIFIDKFDFFEERKLELIEAIYDKGIGINISLNINPAYLSNPHMRPEIFDRVASTYSGLRSNFRTELVYPDLEKKAIDLDHLRENFDQYKFDQFQSKPTNISLYESISTKSEVENIAILINKMIKTDPNLSFIDMALYLTDPGQYENEIIKTFNRYEIPIFLDKRRKMADNHIIKTFLALLRLKVNNYRSEDLFYILNSKLLSIDEEDTNALIKFLSYRKIKGPMFENDKYFTLDEEFYKKNLADDPRSDQKLEKKYEEYQRVNSVRKRILSLIENFDQDQMKVKDLAENIFKMISDKNIREGINAFQDKLLANKALDDYKENEQIWDEFVAILDQLVLLMGKRQMSLARVYSLIESVCQDIQIGLIPPSKDHLIVTDFARDRVSNKTINILMGMDDAYFPSQAGKDYLISPDEADQIKNQNIDLKLYAKDKDLGELLNLYKIISGSENLIFSYALSDKEGKDLGEALFIRDLRMIFPQLEKNIILDLDDKDALFAKESLKKYCLNVLNKIANNEKISQRDKDLALGFISFLKENKADIENKKIYDKIHKGIFYNNNKNPLAAEIRENLYKKKAFSVSEIESYSACPYKHFIAYGLRPEVEKEYDIDALDVGIIVHKSFEELSDYLKDMDLDLADIENEKINQILEEKFREGIDQNLDMARKENPKNQYILKNIHNSAKRNAGQIVDQLNKSDFKIKYYEESFDKGGIFAPVYLDDENYLRGRIDRIDMAGNLVRIIDYKTGSKEYKLANILNGKDLQLIVYLIAVNDDQKNFEPVGAFYISLSDEIEDLDGSIIDDKKIQAELIRKFAFDGILLDTDGKAIQLMDNEAKGSTSPIVRQRRNYKLSADDFRKLSNFVKKYAASLVKDIKAGKIDLRPLRESKNKSSCTYCDYKGICKFDKKIDTFRFRDFDSTKTIKDLEDIDE